MKSSAMKVSDIRDFLVTSSRNVISRRSKLYKSEVILVEGCSIIDHDTIIRADLAPIKIGRYCRLESGAVLRPPLSLDNNNTFVSQILLDYVIVEKDAIVKSTLIESCVLVFL
jgi:carbonic anhydrase/acetyltransferase-like protein (isoleucine patch superfamily)